MEPPGKKKIGQDTKPTKTRNQHPNLLSSSFNQTNLLIILGNLSRPRRQDIVETTDQEPSIAKKDLRRQAPSLGLAEAHVVEGFAAAPPALRVPDAIGSRPEIGTLWHLAVLPPNRQKIAS